MVRLQKPEAASEIDRVEADSKFFRSFTIALLIVGSYFLCTHFLFPTQWLPVLVSCLVLSTLSLLRFMDLRWKRTELTYQYFIASELNSQATHSCGYPDVHAFLQQFLTQVRAVLKQKFVGMYLYGSLALDDFDPSSSDLDILVATASELPSEIVAALKAMHEKIQETDTEWAKRLEVSYTPVAALRLYDPRNTHYPFISTISPFGITEHGRDWIINRYIIREKGIVIAGLSPQTLIAPISEDELKAAVRYILCNSWTQHTSGPEWMRPRKNQAFTILTMCRAWHVLKKGTIVSKPQAAAWAQKELASQWKPLIKRALLWRADPQIDDMTETLSFLRATIEAFY